MVRSAWAWAWASVRSGAACRIAPIRQRLRSPSTFSESAIETFLPADAETVAHFGRCGR
ncbi:hypothetical protein [Streptomyces capparidis]